MNRDVLSPTFEIDNPNFDPGLDWCGPACIGRRLGHDLIPDTVFGIYIGRACFLHDGDWEAGRFSAGNREFRRNIRKLFRADARKLLRRKPSLARTWAAALKMTEGELAAFVYFWGVNTLTARMIFWLVCKARK